MKKLIINHHTKKCIDVLLDAMEKINQPLIEIVISRWVPLNTINISLRFSKKNYRFISEEVLNLQIKDEVMYYILGYLIMGVITIDTFKKGNYIICDTVEDFDNYLKSKGRKKGEKK